MSTVYEVAHRAGVSTATVSRVVHGSSLVRPDTRERVLAVIEELGYVPDGSAQGLSRRRKDIIGLAALERGVTEVGIEKNSPLFMDELVHAVESVLRGTDCSLLLTFGQAGEPFQRRIRSVSGKVDGRWPGASPWWPSPAAGTRRNWTWWRWTTPPGCGRWPRT